jgi:hypothetical protein
MSGYNLPDGVSESDLPGWNDPEFEETEDERLERELGPEIEPPDNDICDEFYDGN